MASTGNKFPTVGANVDRAGSTAWTNPGNVVSDNASDATVVVPSDYLVTSGYDFSAIPDGATIKGVTVRVEASESGGGDSSYIPQLHSNTTPTLIGSAKSAVTVNGTTKVISTTGGVADLWGAALTPAIVKAAGFGVSIWSTDTTNTLAIDFVTIAIEYAFQASASINVRGGGSVTASARVARASAPNTRGGGIVTWNGKTARSSAAIARGGGSVTWQEWTGRAFAAATRGGGAIAITAEKLEQEPITAEINVTGGGSIALVTQAARSFAPLVRGGGSASVIVRANRQLGPAVTGGGSLTVSIAGTHTQTFALVGGGGLQLAQAGGRTMTLATIGGGRVLLDGVAEWDEGGEQAAAGEANVTGGGSITIASRSARYYSGSITGGGSVRILSPRRHMAYRVSAGLKGLNSSRRKRRKRRRRRRRR